MCLIFVLLIFIINIYLSVNLCDVTATGNWVFQVALEFGLIIVNSDSEAMITQW